jgi:acetyltransferase-like isoleucine patch superfamily enzyme
MADSRTPAPAWPHLGAGVSGRLRLLAARLRAGGRLRAGRGVRLGCGVRIDLAPGASITLGDRCSIGARTRLDVAGELRIGPRTRLGERCVIGVRERVVIGARCRLGDEVVVLDFDHVAADPEMPIRLQGLRRAPVAIGDDVVLDDTAVVLSGATVGEGARVTQRTVVKGTVAAGATATGVPAGS